MHLNDSKTEFNSKRDRHENIGLGHLGIPAFQHILNDPRVQNIPLILETPSFEKPAEVWGKEIEVLMKLSGSSGNLEEGQGPSKKLEEGGSAVDEDASRHALEAMIRESVKLAEGESGAGKPKKVVKAKGEGRKRKKGVNSTESAYETLQLEEEDGDDYADHVRGHETEEDHGHGSGDGEAC